jgi:uncharacterized protein YfdQ (DUF2303 family)
MENSYDTEAEASFQHGLKCADIEVKTLLGNRRPFYIVPHTGEAKGLEQFLDKPTEITANPKFVDLDSFSGYVTRFKTEGSIVRGFPGAEAEFQALLDYHEGPSDPRRVTHTARLSLAVPESFQELLKLADKSMNQITFVEFLEDHSKEIVTPKPADVLEIARDLTLAQGSTVKSTVRDGANTKVAFTSETATTGNNDAILPRSLLFSVQPFEGMPARFDIEAVLRVRVNDGNISFSYKLRDVRPKIQQAFRDIGEAIEKATAVPVFI